MIWLILLFCFNFANCIERTTNRTEDELVFVQMIFRHGNRTIWKSYPNDPYNSNREVHWPEGFGQLTELGKRNQYRFGEFLKRRYGKFLGSYSPDKITICSSDFDRTINSGNLVTAALFPPAENQVWNRDLLWQPIPVHSIPQSQDFLIFAETACARYTKILNDYETSREINAIIDEHKDLFQYLEKHSGDPIRTFKQIKDLHNTLYIENSLNKTLPEWARDVIKPGGTFETLTTSWFKLSTHTTLMKRLKSGFLLKEILDRFKNKTRSLEPVQLMHMYSGHETTISSFLNSLNVLEPHIPPYCAAVLMEMYRTSDNYYYIKVFYRNTSDEDLKPLYIPNCGTKCNLHRFYYLYNDILPSNYDECRLTNGTNAIFSTIHVFGSLILFLYYLLV